MGIASRIRWKIGGLLCTVAVVNFFQRVNISVAGDSIMKDFHLTQTQMGTVFSAFVLGYTLFQVPGGMLADRFGPRRVLGCAMATWGIFTLFIWHDRENFPADRAQCFERPDCASIPIWNFSGAYISHEHPHSHQLVPIKRTSPC
jgi:hypothetical protein